MRVLVAEDDEVLAETVAVGLRREGMAVDVVLDGDDALAQLAVNRYDVVVLDRATYRAPTATTSAVPSSPDLPQRECSCSPQQVRSKIASRASESARTTTCPNHSASPS
jgi:DNA-binding NarL/FixJ family response regulator